MLRIVCRLARVRSQAKTMRRSERITGHAHKEPNQKPKTKSVLKSKASQTIHSMKFSQHKTLLLLTLTSARFIGSAAECIETTDVYDDVCSFGGDRTTCGFLPGCKWSGGACVGAECSRHKNENSCNNEMGCFWVDGVLADNIGNVGDYFPPPDDFEDEIDFDHDDVSDWMDQGLDPGPYPTFPVLPDHIYSLWLSTEEKGTKDYKVNLAVKTILFTLLAIVCLVGVVMISKKAKGGDSDGNGNGTEDGSPDEKKAQQKNGEDDDQDMTIEHDEEEGRSWNEINGAPTYEIDSDDE